jgi:tricorn protease
MHLSPKGLLAAVVALLPVIAPAETRLLRHPTYSNGRVAFSYLGDIWVANDDGSGVLRLTDHKAREVFPRFSPDGQWIAFSSNREGNYDVFVIPATGGKARQLTFNTADDMVVGWSADGRKVLFQSTRGKGVFPSVATLFEISADGGMEQPLPTDWGSWASFSADGSKMAFTRHPGVWSRKHYRGSYAVDLWLMEVGAKKFTKLGDPEYKGNYLWPMYGKDGGIYFVADRLPSEKNVEYGGPEVMKSVYNIWKISERGGPAEQVTRHQDGNLSFPSISSDGKTIVYEDDFGLWKLDTASGNTSQIHIDIKSDAKENETELRSFQGEAESFNLSPSTKRAAIAVHGEVFTIATDRGDLQRVTETSWREENPRWSPDGKWIAFISDRTGREEVWMAGETGQDLKQLSDTDCDKSAVVWAPDSKSLLWTGSDRKLHRVDLESGQRDVIVSSQTGQISTPQFSPDGKWISYSKEDGLLRRHLCLRELDDGAEHIIDSEQFLSAMGARWTADGKKIVFLGGVGAPGMASLNRTVVQLYNVALVHGEKNPDDRDVNTEAQAEAALERSRRGGAGTGPDSGRNVKVEVKIEFDGLARRIRQITRVTGFVSTIAPSPDGRTYAFVASDGGEDGGGRPALYTIAEDGTRQTLVTQGAPPDPSSGTPRGRGGFGGGGFGEPQWSKDGRNIFYLQGGGVYSVAAPAAPADDSPAAPAAGGFGGGRRGGRGSGGLAVTAAAGAATSATPRRVDFTVRLMVDHPAERREVFEEAWRVMKNRFYDPKMHGVDWAAAKEKYEPLLADVADSEELHTVIMQMIGELNASHTGVSGGGETGPPAERVQTRHPGFDLVPDSSGFYKISRVYKKGPADHEYVKLTVGDYVLSVNGKELRTTDNYWKAFNLIPGRKFEFALNSKPEAEGSWKIDLDPLTSAAQSDLDYDLWVESRKETATRLSNGRVGYLHIKAMDAPSLRKFERDLLENLDKKALIIDERFNGGGGIDQELLQILNQRKQYQFWSTRGSGRIPRPVQAFFGPMAVLQNERSASDAEMFPDGFRALGLGKLIGVPTYGAVIGTGAFRLLDGSSIRTPGSGVFTRSGRSLENYGVQPDIEVDNTPEDFLAGRDRQVEKAVEVLLSEVK